jgi:hypothetical protein
MEQFNGRTGFDGIVFITAGGSTRKSRQNRPDTLAAPYGCREDFPERRRLNPRNSFLQEVIHICRQ